MRLLPALTAAAGLALVLAACGNDDDDNGNGNGNGVFPGTADDTQADDDAASDDSSSPLPSGSSGSGSLTVDGQTFAFTVEFCGFDPSETGNEDALFSLYGRGETDDGESINVDAVIVDLGDIGSQSVSLWLGNFEFSYEASRIQMGDTVTGTGEASLVEVDLDWPLIEIDGKNIRAETGFLYYEGFDHDEEEPVGLGVFEATCP